MSTPPNSENPDAPLTDGANPAADESATAEKSATVVELNGTTRVAAEATDEATLATEQSETPAKGGSRSRLPILLFVLLLVSVVLNISQLQQQRTLATQASELETALDGAMARIDEETIRANHAEGTLAEVDRNVDNVQERIAELQSALTDLSKATAR